MTPYADLIGYGFFGSTLRAANHDELLFAESESGIEFRPMTEMRFILPARHDAATKFSSTWQAKRRAKAARSGGGVWRGSFVAS